MEAFQICEHRALHQAVRAFEHQLRRVLWRVASQSGDHGRGRGYSKEQRHLRGKRWIVDRRPQETYREIRKSNYTRPERKQNLSPERAGSGSGSLQEVLLRQDDIRRRRRSRHAFFAHHQDFGTRGHVRSSTQVTPCPLQQRLADVGEAGPRTYAGRDS